MRTREESIWIRLVVRVGGGVLVGEDVAFADRCRDGDGHDGDWDMRCLKDGRTGIRSLDGAEVV